MHMLFSEDLIFMMMRMRELVPQMEVDLQLQFQIAEKKEHHSRFKPFHT